MCTEGKCTGEVYIFSDAVRVPCPGGGNFDTGHFDCVGGHLERMTEDGMRPFRGEHDLCHGLGYIPSDSLEVWLGVRRQVTLRHRCTGPDFPKKWGGPTMKTTEDGRAEPWEASYPCPNPDHDQQQEYQTHSCLWAEAPEPLEAVLHALAPALGVKE